MSKIAIKIVAFLILMQASLGLSVSETEKNLDDGVVKIYSVKRPSDTGAPWQYESVTQQQHLGIVLQNRMILTTAYTVADATLVEMQRFGSARKDELQVVFADYESNLAILKPLKKSTLEGMQAMPLGDDLKLNSKVDIYRPRDDLQLTRMPASLQEVGIFRAVTSANGLATYLLKVQQTGLGWSEPVIENGRLVGLTMAQDTNFVHAIPMSVIRHFLADAHNENYRGFPSMGVTLTPLISPDLRRLLRADKVQGGIRIAGVQEGAAFRGLLRPNDVLLEVDGMALTEQGFYRHALWGKMHLKHLVSMRYSGDTMNLKVLRDGEQVILKAKMQRFDSNRALIPFYQYGQPTAHLIFGGLVFQELSLDYLKQWGHDWRQSAPYRLLYLWEYDNDPRPDPEERIIVLSRVLSDQFNRGYSGIKNAVVDTVNGVRVKSMAHLQQALLRHALARGGEQFARIAFTHGEGEAILKYGKELEAAHRRIARTYEIKTPESFFNPSPSMVH